MPLPDEIRDLADRILARMDEARDYYQHTRQVWRVVSEVADEGRSVGMINEGLLTMLVWYTMLIMQASGCSMGPL